jgi:hypothetical protein
MGEVSQREVLQEMAESHIGSPALMDEAKRIGGTMRKPSPALAEAGKRAAKIWLPAGKKSARDAEQKAAEKAFYDKQVDLEDAVEAAGGKRGGC